jgi:hypothetical protein
VSKDKIICTPRPDATLGTEVSALANVYAFILQKHQEKQKGGPATAPDNPERRSNEIRARTSIP